MKTTDAVRRLRVVSASERRHARTIERIDRRRLDRAGFITDALNGGDTVTAEYWARVLLRELADHNEKTKGDDAA